MCFKHTVRATARRYSHYALLFVFMYTLRCTICSLHVISSSRCHSLLLFSVDKKVSTCLFQSCWVFDQDLVTKQHCLRMIQTVTCSGSGGLSHVWGLNFFLKHATSCQRAVGNMKAVFFFMTLWCVFVYVCVVHVPMPQATDPSTWRKTHRNLSKIGLIN